jgi:hypothetical protein
MASHDENEQHILFTVSVPNEPSETLLSSQRWEGGRFFREEWLRLMVEHSPDPGCHNECCVTF